MTNGQAVMKLVQEGIRAAEGAIVTIEALYERNGDDPSNNDNYCRLCDWRKTAVCVLAAPYKKEKQP